MEREIAIMDNATVEEFIVFLQGLNPKAKLVLSDPDTHWLIDRVHVYEYDEHYYLTGEYHEMTKDWNALGPVS